MEIVSVADLKIGMFVAEPDCPWTEFNFAFQGFVISTPDQVDIFQSKCRFVYIDRTRSLNEHYAPTKHEKDAPLKASPFQSDRIDERKSSQHEAMSLTSEKRQSRRRRFLDFLHSQSDNFIVKFKFKKSNGVERTIQFIFGFFYFLSSNILPQLIINHIEEN